jgi:hypothetical protein
MKHRVVSDCIAWSTTMKKGQRIADANAKPVPLSAGVVVEEVGVAVEVAPRSLFVARGDEILEVRAAYLAPG